MIFKRLFSFRKIRTIKLRPHGNYHNLELIYGRINERYFEGRLDLKISWFGKPVSKAKRRLVLGSYHQQKGLIRINRVLDHDHIPDHFVSFIIYHEMLHHVLPPLKRGKRRIHHAEFSAREKQFQDYAQASAFRKSFIKEFFMADSKKI